MNNKYLKEFEQNEKLYNFKKVIKVPLFTTLDNKFYNIEPTYPILFDDFNKSELDEVERVHKMKFDACKADINNLLTKPNKTNPVYIFCFVFDLSNFSSFEKIEVYYKELERVYNFKDKYKQILVGNKLDLAFNFKDEEKEKIKIFINEHNLKYYEISTKMIFNFEIFYASLFYTLFKNESPMFLDKFFMESFHHILNFKETFAKSQRSPIKSNGVPGPEKYDSNQYDISAKDSKSY